MLSNEIVLNWSSGINFLVEKVQFCVVCRMSRKDG